MHSLKAGDRIGSYVLEKPLGGGEAGATWIAAPSSPDGADGAGREVVLKVLDIGEAKDWTGFELFGREVDALKTLSHPGIPRFIESFEDDSGGDTRLVLAMERAPGIDLAAAARDRRFTEAEVSSILAGLADILAYLGSLRPPVVHRDVSPRNVLVGPDGRVYLVDFSGAQEALRLSGKSGARTGATLIGTVGYIPIEQVSGKATTRSDLYGAAATALFLLTRRNPSELPLKDLKPDLSALPSLGPGLEAVLDSWLEADEGRRSLAPAEAARILRGEVPPPRAAGEVAVAREAGVIRLDVDDDGEPRAGQSEGPVSLPSDSKIKIIEDPGRLEIKIPPSGLGGPAAIGLGGFSFFWLGFVAFWTFMAILMKAPFFFVAFSIPFWAIGIVMVRTAATTILGRTDLVLDAEAGLSLTSRMLGKGKTKAWPLADLGKCSVAEAAIQMKGKADKELVIEAGTRSVRLGRALSERELRAIAGRIELWRRSVHLPPTYPRV